MWYIIYSLCLVFIKHDIFEIEKIGEILTERCMQKCTIMPRVNHFLKAWVLKEILYIAPKPLIFVWSFRDTSFSSALWSFKKWQNIPNLRTYTHIWEVLSHRGEWDDWPLHVLIKSDWLIFKTASNLNDISYLNEILILRFKFNLMQHVMEEIWRRSHCVKWYSSHHEGWL